jgi:predicted ATPase
LTVTGVGGVGKTRLAIEVAGRTADQMHGTWFVDLAAVDDESRVVDVFATTLGVPTQSGSSIETAITTFLDGRSALIVVDNCEHVLEEAARLIEVVASACPAVTILATSREPLGLAGETAFHLEPLVVGDDVETSPATRLFVDRARAARVGFDLTDENRSAVRALCEGLEGIPLALELAAARVRTMTPAEIARRLDRQLSLGTPGRGRGGRHETLRAAIDWSYNLLDSAEREVLHRLSVFSGTFDLPAAEAVVGGDGIHALDVADHLAHLVDKSLVSAKDLGGETRYRLLSAIREYAGALLADDSDVRTRHAHHYTKLATTLGVGLRGPAEAESRHCFDTEIDNLRSAISWAAANGQIRWSLEALASLCVVSCALDEVWAWATSVAETAEPNCELWPAVIAFSAWDHVWQGDIVNAEVLANRALDASRADPQGAAYARSIALSTATSVALHKSDPLSAHPLALEWHAVATHLDDTFELVQAKNMLGIVEGYVGGDGRPLAEEALALARDLGQPTMTSFALQGLASVVAADDPRFALTALDEAMSVAVSALNPYAISMCHTVRAAVRSEAGDTRGAAIDWLEASFRAHAHHDRWQTAMNLAGVAAELAATGNAQAAATIAGWIATVTDRSLDPLGNYSLGDGNARSTTFAEQLADDHYAELVQAGRNLTDDEVLEFARRALGEST